MQGEGALFACIRQRAHDLGFSLSKVCRDAGISRQTLYDLRQVPAKLPDLHTIAALSQVLHVHPVRLVHLIFETPAPPAPEKSAQNEAQNMDACRFVRDVNFADGERVLVGQSFTKTWELQNAGSLVWEDRHLVCMDEDVVVYMRDGDVLHVAPALLPVQFSVPIDRTEPGELVQVSMDFQAPDQPCTVLSYWKQTFADGSLCYPDNSGVWVKVRVDSMDAVASAHCKRLRG